MSRIITARFGCFEALMQLPFTVNTVTAFLMCVTSSWSHLLGSLLGFFFRVSMIFRPLRQNDGSRSKRLSTFSGNCTFRGQRFHPTRCLCPIPILEIAPPSASIVLGSSSAVIFTSSLISLSTIQYGGQKVCCIRYFILNDSFIVLDQAGRSVKEYEEHQALKPLARQL